jgi:hypothetical protein
MATATSYGLLAQRLLPALQELIKLPDSDVIPLLIYAAQANAGVTFRGSRTKSAWDELDHSHLAQGLWAEFKEKLRSHVECGIDQHELCELPGLAVNGVPVKPDFTHGDLEDLIDAQLRPHPDDVDEDGDVITNSF